MTKKNITFYFLFLLFICIWLVIIIDVISNGYSMNQTALSSSLLAGYSGLLYWLITGVSAATSFTLGLDKLGIFEDLRVKIFSDSGGYEPEVYVAIPESQPANSAGTSEVEGQLLAEQDHAAVIIDKVNTLIKKENRRSKNELKSFYLFGETDFKSCQHKFGFLGNGFENKPIPDECFGCPKVIKCFKKTKKGKKKTKLKLSTTL